MNIAHINKAGDVQSVEQHCRQTAKIAGDAGKEQGIENLAYITGLLHDCGKETSIFSKYIQDQYMGINTLRRGAINHSSAGARYLNELIKPKDVISRLTCQLMAYSIAAHHGVFDVLTEEGKNIYQKRVEPENEIYYEEAIKNYTKYVTEDKIKERFQLACQEVTELKNKIQTYVKKLGLGKQDNIRLMEFALGAVQRFLLSIVIDADRIDTCNFMMGNNKTCVEIQPMWKQYQESINTYLSTLPTQNRIGGLRAQISQECYEFAKHETGVYKLSCPTGGGKTLASFRYALAHAIQYEKKHIIYIAPYRSILEQNCEVIKEVLKDDGFVLEHHSDVIPEDKEQYQYLTERYDSPIIFTTMVQFLNTLFSKRTQSIRRFHNFAKSIIIVDEVQSIPVKCIHLFNQMVNFFAQVMDTTFIMCTATQPCLEKVRYPLLYSQPQEMIQNTVNKYREFKRVEIRDRRKQDGYDPSELRDLIVNMSGTRDSILVIVNTKHAAKLCFDECKEYFESVGNDEIVLYHLSTNMCPQHRMDELEDLRDKLGKRKVICISTQLIEAGVDVSFQCVIRSFAGLDSIAQAAGRCNRHGEEVLGEVLVVNYNAENLSMLDDIREGQQATGLILDQYQKNAEIVDHDLLSIRAMELFYQRYYFNRMDEMNYSIKKRNTSVMDMLSSNYKGCMAIQDVHGLVLRQAFETAGDCFEVIDSNTFGILVPYGEGKELIHELNGKNFREELSTNLKKAQRYTVNVYQQLLHLLEEQGAIYELAVEGVYALSDSFYSTSGLQLEGQYESLII